VGPGQERLGRRRIGALSDRLIHAGSIISSNPPCVKGIGKQYRGLRTRYLATGAFRKIGKGHKEKPCAMSNPNPPNKFKKGEPRPAGAGRRPGAVNHLTTARVKTERKVRVV
jgi:hypothetical protein